MTILALMLQIQITLTQLHDAIAEAQAQQVDISMIDLSVYDRAMGQIPVSEDAN